MARPLRIEYSGAVYHVTSRGNEQKAIYKDSQDRKRFLEILVQSKEIYHVELYSYVLMTNHFHLLLKTPLGNLGMFMRHFNITYTSYFNRRHKRSGHLYQGRYKSMLVDTDEYLSMVSRYIHLNPVRVRKMRKKSIEEKIKYLRSYDWSSYPGYISKRKTTEMINYEPVLSYFGGINKTGRREYKKLLITNMAEGLEIKDKIVGQNILGSEEFIEWIRENILDQKRDKERPSLLKLQKYKAKEAILKAVEKETGKSIDWIKKERGATRQMTMDLLYRLGGLRGRRIGELFGVDYSTVSHGRKRWRERAQKDKKMRGIINRIEVNLATIKI